MQLRLALIQLEDGFGQVGILDAGDLSLQLHFEVPSELRRLGDPVLRGSVEPQLAVEVAGGLP